MNIKNKIKYEKIFILALIFLMLNSINSYSSQIIDKKGRVVDEIYAPKPSETIDPDTISDAERIKVSESSSTSNRGYEGPSKNIFSDNTIYQNNDNGLNEYLKNLLSNDEINLIETYGGFTRIRHTQSITNVDEDRYELIEDYNKDRLRLKIIITNVGTLYAKNGFYKLNEKVYYFDEDGLMVLGPALDSIGNYYFFSYETGELIEEIDKK